LNRAYIFDHVESSSQKVESDLHRIKSNCWAHLRSRQVGLDWRL